MKVFEFLKKVLRKIEVKTVMLRKRILYTLIDTPVQVRVYEKNDYEKTVLIYDEVKGKPLAELEIKTNRPFHSKDEITLYFVENYKIYK